MNIKGCLLHTSDEWKTPKDIYNFFINGGCIDTFPFKADFNELENNYYSQKLFVNPPFSKMPEVAVWLEKQIKNNCEIFLLIPARTDTRYFHNLIKYNPAIYFIKGRLKYNDSNPAPFPTILMAFRMGGEKVYSSIDNMEDMAKKIIL